MLFTILISPNQIWFEVITGQYQSQREHVISVWDAGFFVLEVWRSEHADAAENSTIIL